MAVEMRDIAPVAHVPLVLGVFRKLNVASLVNTIIPPHPEHVPSCGRGVEALVLAILDGHHARYKVGARGVEDSWYEGSANQKSNLTRLRGP